MSRVLILIGVAAVALGVSFGCTRDKKAASPTQFEPPPKQGPGVITIPQGGGGKPGLTTPGDTK